jgi:general secretion pathway protein F
VPVFQYKAANDGGDVVQGEMEAASQDAVIRNLQSQGHIPIRAEEIISAAGGDSPSAFKLGRHRPRRRDADIFIRELGILLQAGVPLDRALLILISIADSAPFRGVLEKIQTDVRDGATLSVALTFHGRLFPRFCRGMVKAGEASGALGAVLSRLTEFEERSRELRDSMLSALLYPVVLVVVGIVSMGVILGVVFPRISQMFSESGQPLPWFTQVVVATGGVVQEYWWAMPLLAAGFYIFMRWQYARPVSRLRWDRRLLRMPLLGALIVRLEAARFTRTLGGLLGNGVALPDAITIAREVLANRVVAEGMHRVDERVRQGEGFARPLGEVRVFPPLAGHLMQVGEESGSLEAMLVRLAQIYEHEVDATLRRWMAVLEAALIVGLAAFVSVIILSLIIATLSIN